MWRICNARIKFAPCPADAGERMLEQVPAKSNAQRQREFQLRNPGYDGRRKAAERASARRGAAQIAAMRLAAPTLAMGKFMESLAKFQAADSTLECTTHPETPVMPSIKSLAAAFAEVTARAAARG